MKLPKSLLKTANTMYIYGDGHAVIWHRRMDKDAGQVEWVTLHQNIGVQVYLPNGKGRLICSRGAIAMALAAKAVRAHAPSVDQGSEYTKERDILVGPVGLDYGMGYSWLYNLDRLIHTELTYDNAVSETWDDIKDRTSWGSTNISRIYPVKEAA